MSQILVQQQQTLKASQLLRQGAQKWKYIRFSWSDGGYGRCAIGVIMSELGWNGKTGQIGGKISEDTAKYFDMYIKLIGDAYPHINGDPYGSVASFSNDYHTFEESADWMESHGL